MITVPCTPDEHHLIVGGAIQLVIPGEKRYWRCGDCDYVPQQTHIADKERGPGQSMMSCPKCRGDHTWTYDPSLAPQRWVDATGPCPTCDGRNGRMIHGHLLHEDLAGLMVECPDCIDGRKRVALAVTCWACDGKGTRYERGAERWCSNCDHGSVVFAHATVEAVLPVLRRVAIPRGSGHRHAGHPTLCVGWDSYDVLRLWRFAPLDGQPFGVWCSTVLEVDPLPVSGRDFVVLLDNVEMT